MVLTLNSEGWTNTPLHPSARTIYVSDSDGDDSYDGLTPLTPKKNIHPGFDLIRNGYGDHLRLKRGDVFSPSAAISWPLNFSGLSVDYPIVIGSYGVGERPLVRTSWQYGFMSCAGGGNPRGKDVVIRDLWIRGRETGTPIASAAPVAISVVSPINNLLIEGCLMERGVGNIVVQGVDGVIQNTTIRRNTLRFTFATNEAHAGGLYCERINGLVISENFFDKNGHLETEVSSTGLTQFRHNNYVQGNSVGCSGVVVTDNISTRAIAQNFSLRSPGIVSGNIAERGATLFTLDGNYQNQSAARVNAYKNIAIGSTSNPQGASGWQISVDNSLSGIIEDNLAVVVDVVGSGHLPFRSGTCSGNVIRRNVFANPYYSESPIIAGNTSNKNEKLYDNTVQLFSGAGGGNLINDVSASFDAISGNIFWKGGTNPEWFWYSGLTNYPTVAQLNALLGSVNFSRKVQFVDNQRGLAKFQRDVIGGTSSLEECLQALASRREGNWDTRYNTTAIAQWIREGWTEQTILNEPIVLSAIANSVSSNGISWRFTENKVVGQYVNGDWWVLGTPGVVLSSITPQVVLGPSSVNNIGQPYPWGSRFNDRNGSMLNPHWTSNRFSGVSFPGGAAGPDGKSPGYGFHGSATPNNESWKGYTRDANFAVINTGSAWVPISNTNRRTLLAGNSLVSCDSTVPGNAVPPLGRTAIRKQAILTCVSAIPAPGSFRPGYAAVSKEPLLTTADIDYSVLNNLEASNVASLLPSSTYLNMFASALKFPTLIHCAEDFNYAYNALENTLCDGYGQSMANIQNTVLAYINTNILNLTNKTKLANYIIQRAIDCYESIKLAANTLIGGTYYYPRWTFGGAGQMNSMKAPLVFLAGMLYPGSKKTEIKNILESTRVWSLTNYPVFVEDSQPFEVTQSSVNTSRSYINTFFPQYSSVINTLAYSTSDIGSIEVRSLVLNNTPITVPNAFERKPWSREEVSSTISNLPGYSPAHLDALWDPYKLCCTVVSWIPLAFAFKAMGIEKIISSDLYNKAVSRYMQRQAFGPFAHAGSWLDASTSLTFVSGTTYQNLATLSTEFGRKLYQTWVKNSMEGASGAGTLAAARIVKGIESVGTPTNSNIYIDVSTPFVAGQTNTVYCRGLTGFTNSDYMTLFISLDDNNTERYIDIFGIKLLVNASESAFQFTIPTGGSVGSVNIPVISTAQGVKYIVQAIVVRVVNGQLQINSTNALKVTIQ
jgi:hypothetical protein